MKKTLLLSLLFLSIPSFLLFHDKGNELIKPYLNNYLSTHFKSYIGDKMLIEELTIEDLKIDISSIKCTTQINNKIEVQVEGKLSILEKKEKILHDIEINIQQGEIEEILKIVKKRPFAQGKMDIDIKIPTLENNLSQTLIETHLDKVLLNPKVIKKEFDMEIPAKTMLNGRLYSTLMNNILTSKGYIETNSTHIDFKTFKYYVKTKRFQSDYHLKVADLKEIKALTHKDLRGAIEVNGNIIKDKELQIDGFSHDLDGEVNFTLIDKKLNTIFTDISVQKVMSMMNYPQIFKATLVGKLTYNLENREGVFGSKLNQAQLLPNQLTRLIKEIQGADLTKERYNQTIFNAKFNQNTIGFDFYAKSKTTELKLYPATINEKKHTINAYYTIQIEDKDVEGEIKGKIENPKITIESSKFIQKKIVDTIKEYIDIDMDIDLNEDTLKKIGIGEKEKKVVKELFKDLLNSF